MTLHSILACSLQGSTAEIAELQNTTDPPQSSPVPIATADLEAERCFDWMNTSGSCHYAKNRSSFSTYRPVEVTIGANNTPILGVGTVELEVKKSPSSNETGRIVLYNVVHMPSAICNGFSPMTQAGEGLGTGASFGGTRVEGTEGGMTVWYTERFCGLDRLVLAGNPQGESHMTPGSHYSLSLYLSADEKRALGI
ncbi:uncharacterized protein PAC_06335 [Phialocephala subalpina]|uniref:Retrovirus-related Pol polyprotein from transposon TNT 1-94-like beta-barrel domain-containing protein n=1 Tax=Phialocephala subalpina TaxID=576137 RepID=A0A1L7WUJ6_9HELO|nr:uncharacterized protein PAC_06335 [Phialocephala subalpina]